MINVTNLLVVEHDRNDTIILITDIPSPTEANKFVSVKIPIDKQAVEKYIAEHFSEVPREDF